MKMLIRGKKTMKNFDLRRRYILAAETGNVDEVKFLLQEQLGLKNFVILV